MESEDVSSYDVYIDDNILPKVCPKCGSKDIVISKHEMAWAKNGQIIPQPYCKKCGYILEYENGL